MPWGCLAGGNVLQIRKVATGVRVLTYNLQEGGGDRLDRIAAVVRRQRPDAVALQEVTSEERARFLAQELEMQLVFGETNIPCHIAWLSRFSIRRSESYRFPTLSKGLLEVEVDVLGDPLRLFTTHLASRHDAQTPDQEISVVLEVLRHSSDTPHVLAGDLNSLRPGDSVGQPPLGEEKRGDARDGAPRKTIQSILDAGYTDCYRAVHPYKRGYSYPSPAPWLRLDYIFASAHMAPCLRDCDVVQDAEAVLASDHLPVWAEFRRVGRSSYEG